MTQAKPSPWLAIGAGTDLRAHARDLQRSWERLVVDGALTEAELPPEMTAGLRPAIVESWRRSLAVGLDPTNLLAPIIADELEVRERWREHPIGSQAHVLDAQFKLLAEESGSLVVITDESGMALHLVGADHLKEVARATNLVEGAVLSEAGNGTNGNGTALAADHPVQVFGSEHFNEINHDYICSGAPVHDPVSGQIVGVIDLASPWRTAHPRSLELVATTARTIDQSLRENRREQVARLRVRYGDLMTRRGDLLVDRGGYLLAGDERRRRTLLEVPEGGGEVVLDDRSIAVAEPLGHGEAYLVRRVSPPGARSVGVNSLKRIERHARELGTEQAALRQIATLVARESSSEQLLAVVAAQVARILQVPLTLLVRYEHDASVVVGSFGEGDEDRLRTGSRLPPGALDVVASVRKTGRAARVPDPARIGGRAAPVALPPGMRSAVASPVVVGGRSWGAMVIASPTDELPEDMEARLTDFTELVVTAIANAESRAELAASEARAHELADEQSALRRIATLVAMAAKAEEVFSAVAQEVAHVFGVQHVTVCRHESDTIAVLSSYGEPIFPTGSRWPLDIPSLPACVHRTGRAARIDDYSHGSGLDRIAQDAGIRAGVGVPIVVGGTVWGSINVASSGDHRFSPDSEERLARFTELIATSVTNATMREELAASRARIINAGDDSRRRIERDLHDGAQQRLVTLAIALRRVELTIPAELGVLRAEVTRAAELATSAVGELRELCRGIHPSILTDGGLSPALKALARRSPVRVKLDLGIEDRLPDQVEVAAYYTVSEALTNASKHANATRVRVSVRVEDKVLLLSVRDDGVGGVDPRRGSGLIGLRDRIDALGGEIHLESPPGEGTSIEARIPILDSVEPPPRRPPPESRSAAGPSPIRSAGPAS